MSKHSWHDPHVIRAGKSFLKALFTTLGVFLMLVVSFHIGGALYVSHLSEKAATTFQSGINEQLNYLKQQGDKVAENQTLVQYLLSGDAENLLSLIQEERTALSLGSIGVANQEGIIISRTRNLGVQGDNVFLTIPEGRAVAKGESIENIGQGVNDPSQMRLLAGRPIMNGDSMVGGLFVSELMDDAYATRFRDTYLAQGVEVVFYNKQFGVYGDSFSDPETRLLVNSYFNSNSEWIKNGISEKTLSFRDGSFYLVKNLVFTGSEESPGGALIFIPRKDISNVAKAVISVFTLLVFILLAFYRHSRTRGEERGWRYYVMMVVISLPVLALTFLIMQAKNTSFLQLKHIPYTLYNSTLRFRPEFGIYNEGYEQRFSVIVDTGDEAINIVKLGLVFDPEAIEVKGIEATSSTCSYIVENKVNQTEGTADLTCAILNSQGARGSLKVADVVVVPKRNGNFTLSFDQDKTQVLASDGLGTNVLRMSQAGSYNVGHFNLSELPDSSTSTPSRSFIVFSPTHPNQARSYNSDSASFVWRGKPGAVYAYAFDNSPDTIPSNQNTLNRSSIDLPVSGNGIFYFHLRLASGGPVAHYRLQVDLTPPLITAINLSAEKIFAGDVLRLSFEAKDVGSGVQRNFYVDLGGHLLLPVGSQLFVPFLDPGNQKITLRVYDAAGNYSEQFKTIYVEPKPRP